MLSVSVFAQKDQIVVVGAHFRRMVMIANGDLIDCNDLLIGNEVSLTQKK